MLTKSGVDLNFVVGPISVDGKLFNVIKLPSPKYYNGVLHKYILVSITEFPPQGTWAEVVDLKPAETPVIPVTE